MSWFKGQVCKCLVFVRFGIATRWGTYAFPVPTSATRSEGEVVGIEGCKRYPKRFHNRC